MEGLPWARYKYIDLLTSGVQGLGLSESEWIGSKLKEASLYHGVLFVY